MAWGRFDKGHQKGDLMYRYSRRHALAFLGGAPLALGMAADAANADDAPPPLSVYSRLPQIESVEISPNGSRVAFTMTTNGEKIIYDYDLTTGDAAGAALEGSVLRWLMWADDDTVLAVTTHNVNMRIFVGDKNTFATGHLLDIRGGKNMQLYKNMDYFASVVMGDYYRYKDDTGYHVTASNLRIDVDGFRSLYSFDPKTARPKLLDEDPRNIQNWVLEPDGHILARAEHDRDTHVWTLRYHEGKTWKAIYSETAPIDAPWLSGIGRDGKSVVVYFSSGPNKNKYCEIDSSGTVSPPFDIPGDNAYAIYHPSTYRLAGFGFSSAAGTTYSMFDPVMARLPGLMDKALEGSYFNIISSMADEPRKLIVYSEGPGDTGSYYFIDFLTGASRMIGQKYPDLAPEWVGEQKLVKYKAADGLEIEAVLTLPPGREAKNLACVALPHGGPQAYDSIGFDWMAQALASRGYAVFQPNFRGSSGYGQDFVDKGHGEWGRKMQTDISDGVRWLAKEGTIDPKRVAIAGGSYGGYAALAGAAIDTGVYTCAVAIAPVSDLKSMVDWEAMERGKDYNSSAVLYWKRFMGDESGWAEVSPAQHADRVDIPVMLIHGKDDDTVPIDQSDRMRDALHRAGKTPEFVLLDEEDHYLSREPTRIQTLEAMVGFLLKHNPPA